MDINDKSANGDTPLCIAACKGLRDIVKLLIANGMNLEVTLVVRSDVFVVVRNVL